MVKYMYLTSLFIGELLNSKQFTNTSKLLFVILVLFRPEMVNAPSTKYAFTRKSRSIFDEASKAEDLSFFPKWL
jgi:hypothetical protein